MTVDDLNLPLNLFQPSYWCPNRYSEENFDVEKTNADSLTEPVPETSKAGFRLQNVVKKFGSGNNTYRAVDDLSFVALENQITVLLGHNGAGKSTTMNMLSGKAYLCAVY